MPGIDGRLAAALDVARKADCVVLALGLTPDLEGEEMSVDAEGFRGGDRTSILLPETQAELLAKVSELGKPVVIVFTTGSAISFDVKKANAALVAWYYGEHGGEAVAQALFGEANPAGRLPITIYASDADLPAFTDYSMKNRTYRYFTGKPLFAFGHGLSYSTFKYEHIDLDADKAGAADTVVASVTLENTSARDGDEVVQLYAHAENPPVAMPIQSLVGFRRVTLKAGERRTVEIALPLRRLRRWDDIGKRYVVDPGAYQLRAGPASDVAALTTSLTVR
jgi:beta-glucosidase